MGSARWPSSSLIRIVFRLPTDQSRFLKLISTSCLISPGALSLRPHRVLIPKNRSGHLISSKNEPGGGFCPPRECPIRQRGTLFGLTRGVGVGWGGRCCTGAGESHGNGEQEASPDRIAPLQCCRRCCCCRCCPGFVIPVRPDPNCDILGKSGPLQPARMHRHT